MDSNRTDVLLKITKYHLQSTELCLWNKDRNIHIDVVLYLLSTHKRTKIINMVQQH